MVLIINGQDSSLVKKPPTITTSIDLVSHKMPKERLLFVIGGSSISSAQLKLTPQTATIFSTAKPLQMSGAFANFLPNARKNQENAPHGILVLYIEDSAIRSKVKIKNNRALKIDENLLEILKQYMVDLAVYATDTTYDSCSVFDKLIESREDWYLTDTRPRPQSYVLRDINAREDSNGRIFLQDKSINLCNDKSIKPFQPAFFKLGTPTPNKKNDCSGLHFFLDNRIDSSKETSKLLDEGASPDIIDIVDTEGDGGEQCNIKASPAAVVGSLDIDKLQTSYTEQSSVICSEANVDIEMMEAESTIEHQESRKRRHFEGSVVISEWQREDLFDADKWLTFLDTEEHGIKAKLPMSYIKQNKDTCHAWLEFVMDEANPGETFCVRCRLCHTYFDVFCVLTP